MQYLSRFYVSSSVHRVRPHLLRGLSKAGGEATQRLSNVQEKAVVPAVPPHIPVKIDHSFLLPPQRTGENLPLWCPWQTG